MTPPKPASTSNFFCAKLLFSFVGFKHHVKTSDADRWQQQSHVARGKLIFRWSLSTTAWGKRQWKGTVITLQLAQSLSFLTKFFNYLFREFLFLGSKTLLNLLNVFKLCITFSLYKANPNWDWWAEKPVSYHVKRLRALRLGCVLCVSVACSASSSMPSKKT